MAQPCSAKLPVISKRPQRGAPLFKTAGAPRKGKATPEAMSKLPGKPSFSHRRHLLLQSKHTHLDAAGALESVIEDYYYYYYYYYCYSSS